MTELNLRKEHLSKMLQKMAELLDISPTQHEDAVAKYEAVTNYLKEDEKIASYGLEMFPQGSFSLGTVTKPDAEDDEVDIDLVCELKDGTHTEFTQKSLKNLIGDRLKSGRYKDMLSAPDGRRCWRIDYAESTKFHLDILPAIPDNETIRAFLHVPNYSASAISITDKEHENYERVHNGWPKSNPKGYVKWFKEQMVVQLNESRRLFSAKNNVKIDEVPDYKVKTPLQRAIQILKRHRNMMWANDASLEHDDKPISIIITTLAAKAYGDEDNLYDALTRILDEMPNYIEEKFDTGKRVVWVENPVDKRENFADKWEDNPIREKNFYLWLDEARAYFHKLLSSKDISVLNESLKVNFGTQLFTKAYSAIGDDTRQSRDNDSLRMMAGTGIISEAGTKVVPKHTFDGSKE